MIKNLLIALVIVFATGCSTIKFTNGTETSKPYQTQEWHHIGIFELVEFSSPVDIAKTCEGKGWQSVQTRRGPLQVLVSLGLGLFAAGAAYGPYETAVACN